MATFLRSDNTWKCLGYPSQALQTIDDLNRKLNYYIYYIDDFNRHELGPDWGVIHYDGTGSVSLNGSTVTVSSAKSGDFYSTSDAGSLIYRPLPDDWIAVEVNVVNVQSLPGHMRTLMVRAGIEANMPFYVITPDNDCSHITVHWRDTTGASAAYAGNNTGLPFDRSKPLRLRIERDGTTLTAKLSYDNGATWQTISSRTMPQMKYVCLCASSHGDGYVVYDDFATHTNGPAVHNDNNIIANENGFQLGSVPGSGEYISPQFSLYGFRATGAPVISWDSGVVTKPLISETTQADFQAGALTNVVATSEGDLILARVDSDINVAHGKPYSHSPNTTPEGSWGDGDVTDGDTNTNKYDGLYASKDGQPVWCQVDLGAVYTIGIIKVWHYYADGRTYYQTKTEVSEDGINWFTIFDSAVSGTYQETPEGKTHIFTPRPVRYIRDYTNGSTVISRNHWVEIQAFESGFVTSGFRISPVYDLSSIGIVASSVVSWNATLPEGTSVTIETNLSLDGGQTWQGWQVCTNGGEIPGITEGIDLSNAQLQVRQTLSTTDPSVTPQLHDMSIVIRPINPAINTIFELDVSLDGGNTWSGWQPVSNGDVLPGVDAATNLDNVKFRYRLTMSSNGAVSPVVSNIRIENIADWRDVQYNDSSWANVYDNGAYGISPWTTQVSGWPDSQARWIWDRKSTVSIPAGDVYFRKKFILDEPKWVTIAFVCDDKAELYVDGQYLLGNANWKNAFANSVYLPAGEHVIAIKGTNSSSGTAGLLVTVRDVLSSITSDGVSLGSRIGRIYDGIKKTITAGLRQVRELTANVYIVDIFNTGPSTRKVGDYFLGVRSEMVKEDGAPPSQGNIGPARKFPFSWVPFVHQHWKPKL